MVAIYHDLEEIKGRVDDIDDNVGTVISDLKDVLDFVDIDDMKHNIRLIISDLESLKKELY